MDASEKRRVWSAAVARSDDALLVAGQMLNARQGENRKRGALAGVYG
jgi:hypothetical protein